MTSQMQSITATVQRLETWDALGWGWTAQVAPYMARRKSLFLRLFLGAVGLCAVGGAALFIGFIVFVYSLDRYEQRPETGADGIVVLTGGSQRIDDALDLLAKGYADRLLISGVNEKTNREQISRLNPGQKYLFDCCIDLDYRARNTIGNAISIRRWTEQNQFASLIVVTSNYHMPRALVELNHAFPNVQKIPYSVAATIDPHSWWSSASTAKLLVSEYLKYVVVSIRTIFEKDPEHSKAARIMSLGNPLLVVAEPSAQ
jgi:uncharacterized SAM-binding protein YcdF (DUF218 family)